MQGIRVKMMVRGNKGFSLFELIVALAVFGIITSMAVPAVTGFRDKQKVISVAEAVYSQLQLGRSEAIKRSETVYVNVVTNADGTDWGIGVSTNPDCDALTLDGDISNDCYLITDDGDANLDTGDGTTDTGDLVYNSVLSSDYPEVELGDFDGDENTDIQVSFDPTRGTATNNTVTIRLVTGDGEYEMKVKIFATGRVRICSPAGAKQVGGYSTDSCT